MGSCSDTCYTAFDSCIPCVIYPLEILNSKFQHSLIFMRGSEVTPVKLKKWLNNRKARLCRTTKDVQPATTDIDNQKGPALGSSGSPNSPGQFVLLVGVQGEEICKGKVFRKQGEWYGKNLEELAVCFVDVCELKVDIGSQLPYPTDFTGTTFAETQAKLGIIRVLWDSN